MHRNTSAYQDLLPLAKSTAIYYTDKADATDLEERKVGSCKFAKGLTERQPGA